MIDKAQLETYRALAVKHGHDSVDASKALLALPVLLAEIDRLQRISEVARWFVYDVKRERLLRNDLICSISSQKALATFEQLTEALEARAGL